jgi:Ca-activated chloride channel family protein
MLRIEHLYFLYALLLVPATIGLFLWYKHWREKGMKKFGDPLVVAQLIPDFSSTKPILKFIFSVVILTLIIVALANLQSGLTNETVKHQGIDLAIAIDVSNSMLAQDVQPSRLERAKEFASQLVDRSPDEHIALIAFAGKAYIQLPVTPDHDAAQMLISNMSVKDAPIQGTNIADAIMLSVRALHSNEKHYKALVIISDGEDHEGGIDEAIQDAQQEGVIIFTVGVGTQQGAPIPVNGSDNSYKKDEDGNVIITKFDPSTLQDIAAKGNGSFVLLGSWGSGALDALLKRLGAIQKNKYDERIYTEYESEFQFFLIPALLLLVIDLLLSERKVKWWNRLNPFKNSQP